MNESYDLYVKDVVKRATGYLLMPGLPIRWGLMAKVATDATGDNWLPEEERAMEYLRQEVKSFHKIPSNVEQYFMKQCIDLFIGVDCHRDKDVFMDCYLILEEAPVYLSAVSYALDMVKEAKEIAKGTEFELVGAEKRPLGNLINKIVGSFKVSSVELDV